MSIRKRSQIDQLINIDRQCRTIESGIDFVSGLKDRGENDVIMIAGASASQQAEDFEQAITI